MCICVHILCHTLVLFMCDLHIYVCAAVCSTFEIVFFCSTFEIVFFTLASSYRS